MGVSAYDKHVLYSTYDVTPLVAAGSNTLIAQVAGGMANMSTMSDRFVKPELASNAATTSLRAMLFITYTDGTSDLVATDSEWGYSQSPTTGSNWYGGEDYDARLEVSGLTETPDPFPASSPSEFAAISRRWAVLKPATRCSTIFTRYATMAGGTVNINNNDNENSKNWRTLSLGFELTDTDIVTIGFDCPKGETSSLGGFQVDNVRLTALPQEGIVICQEGSHIRKMVIK